MFTANVYRVMVCSLSGTLEEMSVVKDVVRKWNQENAERVSKVYLLVEETDHQEDVDVLIGVVGNWVENTDVVEAFIAAGKKVMLFFNEHHDPNNTIASELSAVADYMCQMQQRCYCAKFNCANELNGLLNEQLNEIQ